MRNLEETVVEKNVFKNEDLKVLAGVWKRIIDQQLEENSPEVERMVLRMGDRETVRDYLYERFSQVVFCLDGDTSSISEKCGIRDIEKRKEIQLLFKPILHPAAITVVINGEEVQVVWIPAWLNNFLIRGNRSLVIHELTHISDTYLGILSEKSPQAQKRFSRAMLDFKIAAGFIGANSLITLISLVHLSNFPLDFAMSRKLNEAFVITIIGMLVACLGSLVNIVGYNLTSHEEKANRYAKEIAKND